jgi:hypothetical protein
MKFIIERSGSSSAEVCSAKLKTDRNTKTHRRGRSKQQYGLAGAAPRSRSGTRSRRRTARAARQPERLASAILTWLTAMVSHKLPVFTPNSLQMGSLYERSGSSPEAGLAEGASCCPFGLPIPAWCSLLWFRAGRTSVDPSIRFGRRAVRPPIRCVLGPPGPADDDRAANERRSWCR